MDVEDVVEELVVEVEEVVEVLVVEMEVEVEMDVVEVVDFSVCVLDVISELDDSDVVLEMVWL